ncbi:MAG: ATP-grasp domain-containing protein [Candidatus Pacebacteria bacterium]|nr:ATP-grasp domain-containing protein [Candidatus Paceibacterota bacterium]MCF7863016.1 ATP-grasp domain-containing protein [Candidatus Paceibacterota bacterium]
MQAQESFSLSKLLQKLAPKVGAKVLLEPKWKMAGQIVFRNNRHSFFKYNVFGLNLHGSAKIARDKDNADYFMRKMGYRVVKNSKVFLSDSWADTIQSKKNRIDDAYTYALKIGFPVVVKPNDASHGEGMFLAHNKKELYYGLREVFKITKVAIVQEYILGKDYRVVVLDNEMVSAYERISLNIVGDGKSTVLKLLKNKLKKIQKDGRSVNIDEKDPRILMNLKSLSLSFGSVLEKNQKVFILNNANLSAGGESVDVSDTIHPFFKDLAIRLTKDMGLRLSGVDLIIDGDISKKTDKYYILEINASPGLNHYASMGLKQRKIVEDMYLKILQKISIIKG